MLPVTQGHGVSKRRSAVHDEYAHQIMSEIEAGHPISQRSLASSLGIALGMTNLLLRRLVRKGWVRVSHIRPNRVSYFLTPTGMAEKARMSSAYFRNSVQYYAAARDRIRARFDDLSRAWPDRSSDGAAKRIMFLGTGEVAEIGYVCLQETDLQLAGVIDFQGRARFFGVPVFPAAPIDAALRECLTRDRPMLVAFGESEQVQAFLTAAAVAPERVFRI